MKKLLLIYLIVGTAIIILSLVYVARVEGQCSGGRCNLQSIWRPSEQRVRINPQSPIPNPQSPIPNPQPPTPNPESRIPNPQSRVCPAFVVVRSRTPGMAGWYTGSGVIVSIRQGIAFVLSCQHATPPQGEQQVITPDGRRFGAQLLGQSSLDDLSLFAIHRSEGMEAMRTATVAPRVGSRLWYAGFAGPRLAAGYRVQGGRVTQMQRTPGLAAFEEPEISGGSRQGDSGGPVWDHDGLLVGIISATARQRTICCGLRRMREFVSRTIEGVTRSPAHPVAPSPAHPVTPSPDHPVTPSPDHPVTPGGELQSEIHKLESRIADLQSEIRKLQSSIPPPVSTARLVEQVRLALPPITVETRRPDGAVIESLDVPLGGTLPLTLKPVSRRADNEPDNPNPE